MKIGILQTDMEWCNESANIANVDKLVRSAEDADLYLLPEMWNTGFVIEAQKVATSEQDSKALRWMCHTAAERNCAVTGTLVVRENDKFYNRQYFVTPEGVIARYDKHHLFRIGGETKRFTAGLDRVVVEWQGVSFLLQTCYDLRFPIFARNRLVDGKPEYDVALYLANFPSERMQAWHTLAAARAIENQCYVAGVNRVGRDPYNEYDGGSMVVDPYGKVIASCEDGAEMTASAEVDIPALEAFRAKFPVLDDSDVL
jgi:predicted amidohydrolase